MIATNVVLAGKRLRVWTGGEGAALLLLQSAWGDAEMSWSTVWDGLSRSFSVVAPDLPGLGASDAPESISLAASARHLAELLDQRGIDRTVVVGNSFGVALAIEFAAAYPERTRRLIAVNGTSLQVIPAFLRKLMARPSLGQFFRLMIHNVTYSDKAFAKAFPNRDRLPPGFIEKIRHFEEQHIGLTFNTFLNQSQPQKRTSVPAAVIWGTGDRLVPGRQAAGFRKWLGEAAFIPLEGAGHMPQLEQPAAFVDALHRAAG
jgi:pimeloyl-ACP methyl ester carboxylesterase